MAKTINISDAEWEVMHVLWSASAAMSASQVIDALAGRKSWSPRTVKTLLNRLANKSAIRFEAVGKTYWYRPKVARDASAKREGRSFLARVFGGDGGAMLVHFVKNTPLTPRKVTKLKQILDRKKKQP